VPAEPPAEFVAAAACDGKTGWAGRLKATDPAGLFVQDTRKLRSALGADPTETLFNRKPLSDDR